jgi:predicted ester cyclase
MTREDLARRSFKLIETGDAELAEAIIAPGFVNQEAEDDPEDEGRGLAGPAGFLATGVWLRAAFADLRFEDLELAVDGDTVFAAATMTGRHIGSFQGIAPTGRAFAQKQVHIFRIDDGRIGHHRAVRDDLGLLLSLGWRPAGG